MIVHEHCGEVGAIGAALEASRLWDNGQHHFHRPRRRREYQLQDHAHEETRCYFCKNKCLRTFIDVKIGDAKNEHLEPASPLPVFKTKVPLAAGERSA